MSKIYDGEIEPPQITICNLPQHGFYLEPYNTTYPQYYLGNFSFNNKSMEEIFQKSSEKFYYILNGSGKENSVKTLFAHVQIDTLSITINGTIKFSYFSQVLNKPSAF